MTQSIQQAAYETLRQSLLCNIRYPYSQCCDDASNIHTKNKQKLF